MKSPLDELPAKIIYQAGVQKGEFCFPVGDSSATYTSLGDHLLIPPGLNHTTQFQLKSIRDATGEFKLKEGKVESMILTKQDIRVEKDKINNQ